MARYGMLGCSSGIGRAIGEAVLKRGGYVALTARNPSGLDGLAITHRDRAIVLQLDVTDRDQVKKTVSAAEHAFGGIDVVVNCAGYALVGGIEECSDSETRAQFETNFFGLAHVVRAALPMMRARKSGFIINISLVAGFRGFPGAGFYAASKFAVEGLSEALADELKPWTIRVVIVGPSGFRTDFGGRSIRQAADPMAEYDLTVSTMAQVKRATGREPGDPARGAEAILTAMDSPDPPTRLLLSKAAHGAAQRIYRDRAHEAQAWQHLSDSADFPVD